MAGSDQEKWDARYRNDANDAPAACQVLQEFAHLLPERGCALDLATGRGGNALFLAQHGLNTHAWDISSVVLQQLSASAKSHHIELDIEQRDIIDLPPEQNRFDVIVVSRFLHRPLCPHLTAALRPGGLLYYQTFIREKVDAQTGPVNPDYLLGSNELLALFPGLTIVAYREEGLIGDTSQGMRNEAWLVAQRT